MRTPVIKTAFILGAGLGTRLRPLTDHRPKPLLPIGGRPLITFAMEHLASLGVERFIINTHHCAEVFAEVFPEGRWRGIPLVFRHEPELLDTAGGLKNIEDLLEGDRRLIVYNGDVVSDLPLERLVAAHAAGDAEVTLALRSQGSPLNVAVDAAGRICDLRHTLGNPGVRSCLFTGISVVEKRFLARLTAGKRLSVIDVFLGMIQDKTGEVAGVVIDEGAWHDIGSPEEYRRINAARREAAATANAPDGDVAIVARSALGLSTSAPLSLAPVAPGGSARSFYRADTGTHGTFICMRYDAEPAENSRYAAIAGFLHEIGIAVPRIMLHDEGRRVFVMEDLGARDLWSYRDAPWPERREYYVKTLALAHRLHRFPLQDFPTRRIPLAAGFTPALYRWERDYFREQFVAGCCGIELGAPEQAALEEELDDLAESLLAGPRSLVHRDFQSQNVMISNGAPVLIDFQGMRFGNPFYDLGSLLCDPYVTLSDAERLELLNTYQAWPAPPATGADFLEQFWKAAAQRLMQALGAYGCLGRTQNKPAFLAHIPAGLANLIAAADHARLPRLRELALTCRDAGC